MKIKMESQQNNRTGGTNRVLEKLKASLEAGQFYEAHQMYRTLYFRYLGQQKYEELIALLMDGALLFLEKDQQTSGADLAILLLTVLQKANKQADDLKVELLSGLHQKMKPDLAERQTFLSNALAWSGVNPATNTTGHPDLHKAFAKTFWKEKNYPLARHHFLRSNDGGALGKLLVEQHIERGKEEELDFFITQPVLQALCLRNIEVANDCFQKYVATHPQVQRSGSVFRLPLLNFTFMLLESLNMRRKDSFEVLIEQYKPALEVDPSFKSYLEKIGNLYFDIPSRREQGGGILGMIQSLLGESSATGSAETRSNQQPLATEPSPIPRPTLQPDDLD
ncbi:Golgi to ER traffic protein 4 homolog isoform X2 [Artemia franciscana]|uniref:Golgi to ER traffic protein 4 homolog isoform X2 n=1 Tax=Artemia franciscana TaxID=6661 RepID=UPI0032DB71DD